MRERMNEDELQEYIRHKRFHILFTDATIKSHPQSISLKPRYEDGSVKTKTLDQELAQ